MQRVFIKTLGCKVNTYDTHALANQFKEQGYVLSDDIKDADIALINSCSVTSNAEKEARYLARRYKRENPENYVVLTGCYAQTNSAGLSENKDIDFIIPNEIKEQAVQLIANAYKTRGTPASSKIPAGVSSVRDNRQSHFKSSLTLFDHADSDMTRVNLKIQDGCDGFCSYCLIPYARGASRSVDPQTVLNELERQIARGIKEIVLTGIHIGDYGRDLPGNEDACSPFADLIREAMKISGNWRLRISSLEPSELSETLLDTLDEYRGKVCEHFHLPLQSGNDRILKLMRRTYDRAEYADAIIRLRRRFPNATIGADVIPGFPGETDEEFRDTMGFAEEIELAYLHVFPYSLRPNTAAAKMPGHLSAEIVKERAAQLRKLSDKMRHQHLSRYIGANTKVLWEHATDSQGRRKGHTANYIDVVASGTPQPLPGSESTVSLIGFTDHRTLLAKH